MPPWRTGALDAPDDVYKVRRDAVERSWGLVDQIIDGRTPTVRIMLLDIEEYARHTGHAHILREAVDGRTGESAREDFTL